MGRAGKIAVHVLLAFLAFLIGRVIAGVTTLDAHTLSQAGLFAVSALLVELALKVERAPWRFVAASDILRLARSSLVTCVVYSGLAWLVIARFEGLRALVCAFVIQVFLLASLRVIRRGLHEGVLLEAILSLRPAAVHPALPNLLIVGSAVEAEEFLRAPASLGERYAPVGVVSPLDKETGDELRGICVLGSIPAFDEVLAQLREGGLAPAAILFLADSPMSAFGAERLGRLKSEGVRLLRRHGVVEMGHTAATLREISLEELLSRPPVRLDPEPVRALVAGRRVLVTGAGGSIGSELCRQIAASGCAQLTMLDASEVNLFHIDREIGEAWPTLSRREVLCDVRDAARLDRVFAAERPEIVFHAAALKHVTMVENHPCEGARTNVLGTRNVAMAAKAFERRAYFALISTDKAVRPTNVMGATKRMAGALVPVRRLQRRHAGQHRALRQCAGLGRLGRAAVPAPDRPGRTDHPDRRGGRALLHDHPRGRATGAARRRPLCRLVRAPGRRPDPGDGRAGQDHRPGPPDDRAAGPGPGPTSRSRSPPMPTAKSSPRCWSTSTRPPAPRPPA